MKYLKTYEGFEKFKVGDIVIYTINTWMEHPELGNKYWHLKRGEQYEIVRISPSGKIQVRDLKNNFLLSSFFDSKWFLSREDWDIRQNAKKYNL